MTGTGSGGGRTPAALRQSVGLLLRRSRCGMAALRLARIAWAPQEYVARRLAALRQARGLRPRLAVDPRLGFRRIDPSELPGLAAVLASARELLERRAALLPAILAARTGKHRLLFDLLSDEELERRPELFEFAAGRELVDAATDYLGALPVLWRIGVGLTRPDAPPGEPVHSQLFHLDGEDFAQLKLMVNVSSVGARDGPFSFLSAEASQRVLGGMRAGLLHRITRQGFATTTPRFRDEEVARFVGPDELHRLEGPPGTAVLLDTSRCLHFGSRTELGRERVLFSVGFQRYHLVNETPHNVFAPARGELDPLRRLLIARARPRPIGAYYPEPTLEAPAPAFALAEHGARNETARHGLRPIDPAARDA